MTTILKENNIWNFVSTTMAMPTDCKDLEIHEVNEVKARRILLNRVKYHLIPDLAQKKRTKAMSDALIGL